MSGHARVGVEAALGALRMLIERDRFTIGDLASELGSSRSAAHRVLQAFELQGYVVLGRRGRGYSAGPALHALTRVSALDPPTRFRLRPVIQTVREETGESVHSAVLTGDHVLVLDGRRSAHRSDIGLRVGMTAPANVMAAGKLLLAAMTNESVEALMPDPLLGRAPASIVTMSALQADLDAIRRTGVARTVQESEPGVNSIAVPLDGDSRMSRVALVISVPIARGGRRTLDELTAAAEGAVAEFAARGTVRPWRFGRRD